MRQVTPNAAFLGIGLGPEAFRRLVRELGQRLEPAIASPRPNPTSELPDCGEVRLLVDEQPVIALTTREALDLYYAFLELLEEGLSGTANHTHVSDDDYFEEFAVWIDEDSSLSATLA
jgi:hypothetical protein